MKKELKKNGFKRYLTDILYKKEKIYILFFDSKGESNKINKNSINKKEIELAQEFFTIIEFEKLKEYALLTAEEYKKLTNNCEQYHFEYSIFPNIFDEPSKTITIKNSLTQEFISTILLDKSDVLCIINDCISSNCK